MRKAILALLLTVALVSFANALPNAATAQDDARDNLNPGYYNEATYNNSQFIYIRVTMAGVVFNVTNGDWVIGNNTGTFATSWFAYPANYYFNAEGSSATGKYPPPFITTAAPYDVTFQNDMPILHNRGGVALDFFLMVENLEGWYYETIHSSNIMTDANAVATRLASGEPFKNAFQARAVFVRWGDGGLTSHYNQTNGLTHFLHPEVDAFPAPPFASPAPDYMKDVDLVLPVPCSGI